MGMRTGRPKGSADSDRSGGRKIAADRSPPEDEPAHGAPCAHRARVCRRGEQPGGGSPGGQLGHDRGQMAEPVCHRSFGSVGRPAALRSAAHGDRPASGGCHHQDLGDQTEGSHPLEHALFGPGNRAEPRHHRPDLAGLWAAAAPAGQLQTLPRSVLRREGARHRRTVYEPAGARLGAVCGREEPMPGLGAFPAAVATAPGSARAGHA